MQALKQTLELAESKLRSAQQKVTELEDHQNYSSEKQLNVGVSDIDLKNVNVALASSLSEYIGNKTLDKEGEILFDEARSSLKYVATTKFDNQKTGYYLKNDFIGKRAIDLINRFN